MRRPRLMICLLSLALCALSAPSLRADSLAFASCSTDNYDAGFGTGAVTSNVSANSCFSTVANPGMMFERIGQFSTTGSYANWSSVTGINQLHAETSVQITDAPMQIISGDDSSGDPIVVQNPLAGDFLSSTSAGSNDMITVQGSAPGPLQLRVTAFLDGSVSYNQCAFSDSSLDATFQIAPTYDFSNDDFYVNMSRDACGHVTPGPSSVSRIITVNSGARLYTRNTLGTAVQILYGWLPQSISPNGPVFVQNLTGEANASDTAGLYIDPLTPGVTLDSLSGTDYSTPPVASTVPEPPPWLLLATGLLGLLVLLRTRAVQLGL